MYIYIYNILYIICNIYYMERCRQILEYVRKKEIWKYIENIKKNIYPRCGNSSLPGGEHFSKTHVGCISMVFTNKNN